MDIRRDNGIFFVLLNGWPYELDAMNFLDAEIEADSKYGAKTLLEILDNYDEYL